MKSRRPNIGKKIDTDSYTGDAAVADHFTKFFETKKINLDAFFSVFE